MWGGCKKRQDTCFPIYKSKFKLINPKVQWKWVDLTGKKKGTKKYFTIYSFDSDLVWRMQLMIIKG